MPTQEPPLTHVATPSARLAWFPWLCVFVGVLLRITGLTVHSLWFDEGATLYLATADDMVGALHGSRHPPVAIAMLRQWVALVGESDAMLRLLPALCSCLGLALFAWLARRWCSPGAAGLAVLLFAVSPFQIWYGQEVTPYAFLGCFALLAYVGAAGALAAGRARALDLALVFTGTALAFGTQYLGALTGVAVAAIALAARLGGRLPTGSLVRLVLATLLGGLVWTPWLATVYWQHQRHTVWGDEARTSLRELAELPARLFVVDASALPPAWQWTGLVFGGLVWLGILLGGYRALRTFRRPGPDALPAVVGFLVAIAAALVLAFVAKNFLPRYLTAVAPLAALVVAEGLAALPDRRLRLAAGACAAAALLCLVVAHRLGNRREDYRAACAQLVSRWQPGEPIAIVSGTPAPFARAPIAHYLRQKPELLAALRDASEWTKEDANRPGRVHVLYRVNEYAKPDLAKVLVGRREETHSPIDFLKIQYHAVR